MNTGTISEQRKLSTTTTTNPTTSTTTDTIKTTSVDLVDKQPDPNTVQVLAPTKEPTKPKEPKHLQDSKCTFCKVDAIATLAFRFGLVLVLIALSYHLIKSPK